MSLFISVNEMEALKEVVLDGRIDALTSIEIEEAFNDLATAGERNILVNFEKVVYISSAGLRIFLMTQQKLKNAGGEILLTKLSENVEDVFKMSGFLSVFKVINDNDQINDRLGSKSEKTIETVDGITFEILKNEYSTSELNIFGNQDKLNSSSFNQEDIVSVKPSEIKFGTGLAAVGESYDEIKSYFGESIVLNNNIYFYPAASRSAVDFIEYTHGGSKIDYKFLYGFGFSGKPSKIISYSRPEELIEMTELIKVVSSFCENNICGIVMISESKGHWGMNLKRVPNEENKPHDNTSIFSKENFANWMNFPVEPEFINNIILSAGIITRDKSSIDEKIKPLFPGENNFHIHSAICGPDIINSSTDSFESELERILAKQELLKVQHSLGASKFGRGLIALFELRG